MKGKEQEFEAATTTPGNPGRVYVLDWEAQDQRRVPVQPLHWRMDYDKGADGKRQVSVRQERVRGGQWAARFELRKSDPIVGGYTRCELSAEVETRGDKQWYERWYGFSIYLPDTWTDDQQAEIVTQWHHYDDGYAPGSTEYAKFYGGSPPLSILTKNGEWNIGSRYK